MMGAMKPPMYVGLLPSEDQRRLTKGLRSSNAFELRRCQILLASARGERPSQIAAHVGCTAQPVRNTIRAYQVDAAHCLRARSSRPKTAVPMLDEARRERLRAILHETPRSFGKPTSLWTLRLAAEVCFEQGVTGRRGSIDSIRRALKRMGVGWKRAKHWITSPDPQYSLKKATGPIGSPDTDAFGLGAWLR
jgi:transposase